MPPSIIKVERVSSSGENGYSLVDIHITQSSLFCWVMIGKTHLGMQGVLHNSTITQWSFPYGLQQHIHHVDGLSYSVVAPWADTSVALYGIAVRTLPPDEGSPVIHILGMLSMIHHYGFFTASLGMYIPVFRFPG